MRTILSWVSTSFGFPAFPWSYSIASIRDEHVRAASIMLEAVVQIAALSLRLLGVSHFLPSLSWSIYLVLASLNWI